MHKINSKQQKHNAPPVITLTTDFGVTDGTAGVMEGIIAGIAPDTRVIHLTHQIEPQNVTMAGFLIGKNYRWFPPGSIHIVVVDPGVGSNRKGLVIQACGHCFVGPDNGVFTEVLNGMDFLAHSLENPQYQLPVVSHTFHGRDIFAPAGAWLAQGTPIAEFGEEICELTWLKQPEPTIDHNRIYGTVVYLDRFGNLVTNISSCDLAKLPKKPREVRLPARHPVPFLTYYSAVSVGHPLAVIGGFDTLEIAINQGNAHEFFSVEVGTEVEVCT